MALNVPAASASAALAEAKASNLVPLRSNHSKVSFSLSTKPELRFLSKGSSSLSHGVTMKAQLNKVSATASPTAAITSIPDNNSAVPTKETKDDKSEDNPSTLAMPSEESVSEFISQVANLVKLVDSKDIVELQMKQLDCEVLIRKKEAIAPLVAPPMVMMQPQPAPQVAAAPVPQATPSLPAPSAPSAPPKPTKSSLPPLKSPMAGTLYRSPAPGAPPFVKVGDRVQKGQIICIVEAMKLMNEIEADQSGTIVEFLAEDAKPVSFDTPILVIQP
ncbi:hypothetical protein V2J09_009970 [Rumex salicifolius]